MENYAKLKVRALSYKIYQGFIENHIKPALGEIPLEKLAARRGGVFELDYIDLTTGLRRGEPLGLKWSDIGLSKGVIHVRQRILRQDGKIVEVLLKTRNSYRNIAIGADAIEVLKGIERKDEYAFPSPYGGPCPRTSSRICSNGC